MSDRLPIETVTWFKLMRQLVIAKLAGKYLCAREAADALDELNDLEMEICYG